MKHMKDIRTRGEGEARGGQAREPRGSQGPGTNRKTMESRKHVKTIQTHENDLATGPGQETRKDVRTRGEGKARGGQAMEPRGSQGAGKNRKNIKNMKNLKKTSKK